LKDAICQRIYTDYGLEYGRAQVIVSCGAKHVIYNAAMALFGPGDEVLVPSPYWVSYPDILALTGAKAVIIPTTEEGSFKVTSDQIRKAMTPRTRALILNSPCNPTGAVYLSHEIEEIAHVVQDTGILVISDDIYNRLVYHDIRLSSLASVGPKLKEQTLVVNGVSKTYAMTGWRIGYALGPEELIASMTKIQGQSTSNPTAVAQKAAIEAITGPQACVAQMVREFDRRRRFMVYRLNEMDGISCYDPGGAFYVFPRVDAYFGRKTGDRTVESASDLAEYLLQESKVVIVPGEPFGSQRHLRLSFAVSMEEIEEGLNRIEAGLEKLTQKKGRA
jgi:aspartate aminotransferase